MHYPPRDTEQDGDPIGRRICNDNGTAVHDAEEVHIYWTRKSSGSGFDFGMAYYANLFGGKPIRLVNPEMVERTESKSFENVLLDLHAEYMATHPDS